MPRQHRHALRLGVATALLIATAAPASAAPLSVGATPPATASYSGSGISALADEVRRQSAVSAQVTVASDALWSVEVTDMTVTPKPEPEPEPELEAAPEQPAPATPAAAPAPASPDVAAPVPAPVPADVVAPVEPAPAPDLEVAAAAAPAPGGSLYDIAAAYIGTPYVSGGTSPSGFDCSGFTQFVYAQAGLSLPRSSAEQRNVGTVISRDQAVPGDLIWSPGHVAIYAGGNQQIDAPKPGASVSQRSIWQSSPVFIRVG